MTREPINVRRIFDIYFRHKVLLCILQFTTVFKVSTNRAYYIFNVKNNIDKTKTFQTKWRKADIEY